MDKQLPTEAETLLLEAALKDGDFCIIAWRKWQSLVPFDDIDLGNRRLLPLLHHNLRRLGVEDPILAKYEGLKKLHWLQNQLLMRQLEGILKVFSEAGIPSLLIKGVALNIQGFFPPGLRPMTDMDIIIPYKFGLSAIESLKQLGWIINSNSGREYSESDVRYNNHVGLSKQPGLVVELHWERPTQFYRGQPNDLAWQSSLPVEWAGQPCRVLDPAIHLLLILAHGGSNNNIAPLRWVSDAVAILQNQTINWELFLKQAEQHQLNFAVRGMLVYLQEHFHSDIPASVLEKLFQIPVGKFERRIWTTMQLPNQRMGIRSAIDMHLLQLKRISGGHISPSAFCAYFWYSITMPRNGKKVTALIRNIWRRISNSISVPPNPLT